MNVQLVSVEEHAPPPSPAELLVKAEVKTTALAAPPPFPAELVMKAQSKMLPPLTPPPLLAAELPKKTQFETVTLLVSHHAPAPLCSWSESPVPSVAPPERVKPTSEAPLVR